MRVLAVMALLVLVALGLAALPIDERREAPAEPRAKAPAPSPRSESSRPRRARPDSSRPRRAPSVPRAHCPADVAGCRSVRGRVAFVERVDPDGDGDLHVVVLAGSVTAPGVTAIDVRRDLRPRRDPRVGDQVSAAGPVQRGSFGQDQIHALEFHAK